MSKDKTFNRTAFMRDLFNRLDRVVSLVNVQKEWVESGRPADLMPKKDIYHYAVTTWRQVKKPKTRSKSLRNNNIKIDQNRETTSVSKLVTVETKIDDLINMLVEIGEGELVEHLRQGRRLVGNRIIKHQKS